MTKKFPIFRESRPASPRYSSIYNNKFGSAGSEFKDPPKYQHEANVRCVIDTTKFIFMFVSVLEMGGGSACDFCGNIPENN